MSVVPEAQAIYLTKISEAVARINACDHFLESYTKDETGCLLDAAVLQMRKALEAVAYAAIAPNKGEYARLRADANHPADYRKDYNARAILHNLSKINADFYPVPLLQANQIQPGHWHFERKTVGCLSKAKFESFYDRLGKHLHADNPWGNDKGVKNLVADLPTVRSELRELLALHSIIVRTPDFLGAWVVELPPDGRPPRIIVAEAQGEFRVAEGGS